MVFYYATKFGHILAWHVVINLVINVVIYLIIDSNMTKLVTKHMTRLMTNRQAINDQNKNDQFWSCNKRPEISHQRSPNQKWSLICGFWSFFRSLISHFPLVTFEACLPQFGLLFHQLVIYVFSVSSYHFCEDSSCEINYIKPYFSKYYCGEWLLNLQYFHYIYDGSFS